MLQRGAQRIAPSEPRYAHHVFASNTSPLKAFVSSVPSLERRDSGRVPCDVLKRVRPSYDMARVKLTLSSWG
jgi:hypothetical protein